MKKIKLVLLILWMVVIFLASNDNGAVSTEKSDSVSIFIINIIENIKGEKFTNTQITEFIENSVLYIRKSAHFIEYLILGILVINVFKDYFDRKLILYSLILCVSYAITDEIHQLFISGRSAQIVDILIDSCGSIAGIFMYFLVFIRPKSKKELLK